MQPAGYQDPEQERFITFAAVSDKELDRARTAILAAFPMMSKEVRVATRLLRKMRGGLAKIAATPHDGETDGDQMVRTLVAIQAYGVIGNIDEGTPVDHAGASDEETYHAVVGTAGGWAADLPVRQLRAIFVACFLLNAPQFAGRLAEMQLKGTLPMLAEAMGRKE